MDTDASTEVVPFMFPTSTALVRSHHLLPGLLWIPDCVSFLQPLPTLSHPEWCQSTGLWWGPAVGVPASRTPSERSPEHSWGSRQRPHVAAVNCRRANINCAYIPGTAPSASPAWTQNIWSLQESQKQVLVLLSFYGWERRRSKRLSQTHQVGRGIPETRSLVQMPAWLWLHLDSG